jgi:hypothetical protein
VLPDRGKEREQRKTAAERSQDMHRECAGA